MYNVNMYVHTINAIRLYEVYLTMGHDGLVTYVAGS